MKKTLKTTLVALGLLAFGLAITSKVNATEQAQGEVNLTVNQGTLTISTSGAVLNLGTGDAGETLSGNFPINSFLVSDLKGADSGYYTTIQVTDLTGNYNGTPKIISGENVKFKAGGVSPVKVSGNENASVSFSNAVTNDSGIAINTPVQYIQRNSDGGILGVYGDNPHISVTIPEYTSPTSYHGVITYTLYDCSTDNCQNQ